MLCVRHSLACLITLSKRLFWLQKWRIKEWSDNTLIAWGSLELKRKEIGKKPCQRSVKRAETKAFRKLSLEFDTLQITRVYFKTNITPNKNRTKFQFFSVFISVNSGNSFKSSADFFSCVDNTILRK